MHIKGILKISKKRIFASKNVHAYFTLKNGQNMYKTYYLAALEVCDWAVSCERAVIKKYISLGIAEPFLLALYSPLRTG